MGGARRRYEDRAVGPQGILAGGTLAQFVLLDLPGQGGDQLGELVPLGVQADLPARGHPPPQGLHQDRIEPLGVLILGARPHFRGVLEPPVDLSGEFALPVDLEGTGRHAVDPQEVGPLVLVRIEAQEAVHGNGVGFGDAPPESQQHLAVGAEGGQARVVVVEKRTRAHGIPAGKQGPLLVVPDDEGNFPVPMAGSILAPLGVGVQHGPGGMQMGVRGHGHSQLAVKVGCFIEAAVADGHVAPVVLGQIGATTGGAFGVLVADRGDPTLGYPDDFPVPPSPAQRGQRSGKLMLRDRVSRLVDDGQDR